MQQVEGQLTAGFQSSNASHTLDIQVNLIYHPLHVLFIA
jgi:hypothetical protein